MSVNKKYCMDHERKHLKTLIHSIVSEWKACTDIDTSRQACLGQTILSNHRWIAKTEKTAILLNSHAETVSLLQLFAAVLTFSHTGL